MVGFLHLTVPTLLLYNVQQHHGQWPKEYRGVLSLDHKHAHTQLVESPPQTSLMLPLMLSLTLQSAPLYWRSDVGRCSWV